MELLSLLDDPTFWRIFAAFMGMLAALGGLVCLVARMYLNTVSNSISTLFGFANDHEARVTMLEKVMIAKNPGDTVVMRAMVEGGKKP